MSFFMGNRGAHTPLPSHHEDMARFFYRITKHEGVNWTMHLFWGGVHKASVDREEVLRCQTAYNGRLNN